jgi:hypothetical protein
MIPQFEFPDEHEWKSDANLMLHESPQSTEDKIYSWKFIAEAVEHPDSPDEEERGSDKNECSNEIRKITRPDIQKIPEYYSGSQNKPVLLTEKLPPGKYSRIVFASSGMEDMPEENPDKNRASLYNVLMSSEDEVNKQKLIASNQNSSIHFQVPDIIEDRCESCSSLNECSNSCNMSEMEVESKKVSVVKRCFCVRDAHNEGNNKVVAYRTNAGHRDANQLTLNCAAGAVQNTSRVKDSNKSVQSILGFPSETQDLPLIHQGDNDVDVQVLRPDIPVFLIEAESESDMQLGVAQNASLLCSACSATTGPGVTDVQSALNIKGHTDRTPLDISQCNKSAVSGHTLGYEVSSPDSNSAVVTDTETAVMCQFSISDSSGKMEFRLPAKSSLLPAESTNSVESHKLNIRKTCREQPLRQTSEGTILPCKRIFELSTRLLNNAVFKLSSNRITAHDCSMRNLFRSASAPINFCSARSREKKIPYLLFMSHSCGDVSAVYSIQDLRMYPDNCGEKSALKQEPYAEHSSSVSSAHGSAIETPVKYKQKRKRDRKSSDRKCFSCLLL